ncbi:hypothetical protein X734_24000 [Mesorhizobium sp. L2C084A000]|nr:hypothetical protein X734_24000 [Mesorhizobium sp. L2C084A000]
MGFEWRRYFYCIGRISRWRVCDRNDRYDFTALHDPARGDNGAWSVFATFFGTLSCSLTQR